MHLKPFSLICSTYDNSKMIDQTMKILVELLTNVSSTFPPLPGSLSILQYVTFDMSAIRSFYTVRCLTGSCFERCNSSRFKFLSLHSKKDNKLICFKMPF